MRQQFHIHFTCQRYLSSRTTNCVEQNLLEKLLVTQLVKKIFAFYGTRRFTAVFTTAHQWLLS